MKRLAQSYRTFVLAWAELCEKHGVDMLSVGVELRSWATSARATDELRAVIEDVRARYKGILTYSANWDDVDDTVILREVDAIGINAFYLLADHPGASPKELLEGGLRVGSKVRALADAWQKPVLFTEVGYTTRPDPAVRPWEWPDDMKNVVVDEVAQTTPTWAILGGVVGEPWFAGFFVWRMFSDPSDSSQEAAWGFPFHGKLAEHGPRGLREPVGRRRVPSTVGESRPRQQGVAGADLEASATFVAHPRGGVEGRDLSCRTMTRGPHGT